MTANDAITLGIIIPTLNADKDLHALLGQIGKPETAGHAAHLNMHIVVSDGLSSDDSVPIALRYGVRLAVGSAGRGAQLARGVRWADMAAAHSNVWYLILHTDTQLPPNWQAVILAHIQKHPQRAGYFRYGADTRAFWGRIMEFWVGMRSFWWGLPYGDQGLLISKAHYEAVGGYHPLPLFEDVDMVDRFKARFGRWALRPLRAKIVTDVSIYARQGWWSRSRRNMKLLKAYRNGTPIETLQKNYQ